MRIGCLQFAPQAGDVANNLNRADSVLSRANLDGLDLLVLPELAFSGCNFKSLQEITPFLENCGSGISSLWARTIAMKYDCTVIVGYPEKVDATVKWPTGPEYYNSAIAVNGSGDTIANYRKCFLYHTDESWALEGDGGFFGGRIPGLGNVSIGICMDINPYRFEAPWTAFEFAFHILEMKSNLVVVSMAWSTREDPRHFTRMPDDPDMETLTYWVTRLEPLIRCNNEDEIIVVFCNRTGIEEDATYTGTSAVIGILNGEIRVYGLLGRGEKELLVVDTNNAPFAKLAHQPKENIEAIQPTDTSQKPNEMPGLVSLRPKHDTDPSNQTNPPSEDDQFSLTPTTNQYSEPLPPPPTSSFLVDFVGISDRKHHPPKITIPSITPDLVTTNSAPSPSTNSINIATPSASRTTPLALRPRLIIPESPPILPHQYPSGHLFSPESPESARSVESSISDASMNTVYSNPRRPEDSTPFPQTAVPLSGYPRDFEPDWKIYGGNVSIATGDEPPSPASTCDNGSPTSTRCFWNPADTPIQTSAARSWCNETLIGRQPEPFPWDVITADLPTKSVQNRGILHEQANDLETPRDCTKMDFHESKHNLYTVKTKQAMASKLSGSSERTDSETTIEERSVERPLSPKSRNASRSRLDGGIGSEWGDRKISEATAFLEEITKRAQSAHSMREDRPPSPKSRNCSKTRSSEMSINAGERLVGISPSPNNPQNNSIYPYRPLSRFEHIQRSNSLPRVTEHISMQENANFITRVNMRRPFPREPSRGRRPGPRCSSANGDLSGDTVSHDRSSSRDSTQNDLLHRKQAHSQSRPRRTSSTHHHIHERQLSPGAEASEFATVEHILCHGCPVHGQRSQSNAPLSMGNSTPVHNVASQASVPAWTPGVRPASAFEPRQRANSKRGTRIDTPTKGVMNRSIFQHDNGQFWSNSTATERAEGSDTASLTETLQTVPTPDRLPSTPSRFEPSTPKAMVFDVDDVDPNMDSATKLGGQDVSGTIQYLDAEIVKVPLTSLVS